MLAACWLPPLTPLGAVETAKYVGMTQRGVAGMQENGPGFGPGVGAADK